MVQIETELDRSLRYYRNEVNRISTPFKARIILEEDYLTLISLYWDYHPFRLIWQILWETGVRPIEACWLQLGNIDTVKAEIGYKISKPRITFEYGQKVKTYKTRIVPISRDLADRLQKYIELNKDGFRFGFLFPSPALQSKFMHINPTCLNNELDRHRKKLGGRWLEVTSSGDHFLSPHSFRRSWITRYLNFCKNPAETARAIGHTNIEVTFGYYQFLDLDKVRSFVDGGRESKTPTIG